MEECCMSAAQGSPSGDYRLMCAVREWLGKTESALAGAIWPWPGASRVRRIALLARKAAATSFFASLMWAGHPPAACIFAFNSSLQS